MKQRRKKGLWPIVALFVALGGQQASSNIIMSHVGTNDPLSEGWTSGSIKSGLITMPVDDGGTPAWLVDDRSVTAGYGVSYLQSLASQPQVIADGELYGWELKATFRMEGSSSPGHPFVNLAYVNGSHQRRLQIGTTADGDPVVFLQGLFQGDDGHREYTLTGLGGGYHEYRMLYDPLVSASISVYVDGMLIDSAYNGSPATPSWVWFGEAVLPTSAVYWNNVTFSVVPEPSSLATISLVSGCALFIRRRFLV